MTRPTLASRIALVTTAVAGVAVLIAGVVSYGLVRSAADDEAQHTLARQADIVAGTQQQLNPRAVKDHVRIRGLLRRQGIAIAVVNRNGGLSADSDPLARAVTPATGVAAGASQSFRTRVRGETVLVETRPLESGGAIVLAQRRSQASGLAERVLRRTGLALLAGLAVAALAGVLLARRLARPLQRAASAAHDLARGRRDVRLPTEGPAEVAEVAESLNRLAAALEYSEARQREFLLSVSHELRTPLTAVKGFAESLADGVTAGAQVRPVGATVLAEATRLERLVADLLDLARLGAQDFRIDITEVDLVSLVSDAGAVWAARCRSEGVQFVSELSPVPVTVATDPTRLRQIIDGLAENALRVTPAGRPIVLAVRAEGASAIVEVRDGGPGLTDDDLSVAFDRSVLYERYRGVRRVGTGVGLALVRGLAGRLGGRASATRAAEGGACFAVRLPLLTHPWAGPATAGG
ncbi:MAG: HAMP domain-containing histidine kinase [Actinomycetota bacterium]|nr:HAMP domain-containing histidine kinase [Actinomycetota bacterium]